MAKSVNEKLKEVKCNLKGILLSEIGGVRVETLLSQYEEIYSEPLDYVSLGFKSLYNFLKSHPDVARVDATADGLTRVFGVGVNEMNITAKKSFTEQGKNLPEMVHIRNIPADATSDSLLSHLYKYSIESLRLFPSTYSQIGSFLLSRSEIGQLLQDKSAKMFRGSFLRFIYPVAKKPSFFNGGTVDHRSSYGNDYGGSNNADTNSYSTNSGYTINRNNIALDQHSGNYNGFTIDRHNHALDSNGYAARKTGYATHQNNYNTGSNGYSPDGNGFAAGRMTSAKSDAVPSTRYLEVNEASGLPKTGLSPYKKNHPSSNSPKSAYTQDGVYNNEQVNISLCSDSSPKTRTFPESSPEASFTKRSPQMESLTTKLNDSSESTIGFLEKTLPDVSSQSTHCEDSRSSSETTDCGAVSFIVYAENLPKSVKLDDVFDVFKKYGDFKGKIIHEESLDSDDEEAEVNCFCMLKFYSLDSAASLYREANLLRVLGKPVRLNFIKILSHLKKLADYDNLIVNFDVNTKSRTFEVPEKKPVEEENKLPTSMEKCTIDSMYKDIFPGQNVDVVGCPLQSSEIQLYITHVEDNQLGYFWGMTNLTDPNVGKVLDIGLFESRFKPYDFRARRAVILHEDGYYCRVWVKFIKSGTCEVFFVDFGNTEAVPVDRLLTAPDEVWDLPPLARAFRLESQSFQDLNACLNINHRCLVKRLDMHILVISELEEITVS